MKRINLLFAGFAMLLWSCSKPVNYEGGAPALLMELDKVVANDYVEQVPVPHEKSGYHPKLIKKASLTISSPTIEATKSQLYEFVSRCNGRVIYENLVTNDPYSYYQISLNIQASLFDKFFKLVDSAKFVIVSKSFSSDDVTMQYIDNSTRLENKKKLEARYLELLSKTRDIKDMLEIEEKLEGIRSDIESRENQMKEMEKQIAYSEVSVRIDRQSTSLTFEEKNKYSFKISQGFVKGWQGIKSAFVFLISIWPIYLIVAALVIFIKYWRNRRKNK